MPRVNDQNLVGLHLLQIAFDQAILHPVLKDLTRFPVSDQFVGIEGNVEVRSCNRDYRVISKYNNSNRIYEEPSRCSVLLLLTRLVYNHKAVL